MQLIDRKFLAHSLAHPINQQVLRASNECQAKVLDHIGNRHRAEELHPGLFDCFDQEQHELMHRVVEEVVVGQREEVLGDLLALMLVKSKVEVAVLL
jgi:hypothetical protein